MNNAKHSLEVLILIAGLVITTAVTIPVVTLTGVLSDDSIVKPSAIFSKNKLDVQFDKRGGAKHTDVEMMKPKLQSGVKMRKFGREAMGQDLDVLAERVKKRIRALSNKHMTDLEHPNSRVKDNLKGGSIRKDVIGDRLQGLIDKGIITEKMADVILSHFHQLKPH